MRASKQTLLATLLSLGLVHQALAEQIIVNTNAGGAIVEKKDAKAARTYTPEVEKALKEFAQKATPARKKVLEENMAKVVEDLVKSSKADDATRAKLEAGAKKAVEQTTLIFPEKLIDWLGRWTQTSEEESLAQIGQWPAEESARWPVPGILAPEEQPVWAETIKAALNAEQYEEWEKLAAEKKRSQEEEITRYLKPMSERMKEQFKAGMETETGDIATVLSLKEDRMTKLKTSATEAVTRAVEAWRDGQMKTIREMSEQERKQVFSREGGGFVGNSLKLPRPEQQPEWKDALKAELSTEEFERLESARKERSARRNQAFAYLLLAELDKRVGLTAAQRDRLFPVALKPSRNLIKLNNEEEEEDEESVEGVANWNLQPSHFIAAAVKMPEPEVRSILDPIQWKRWEEYCKNKPTVGYSRRMAKGETEPNEAEFESLVNEYLHKSAHDQEQRLVKGMLVRVEDATRIAMLKPETVAQLTLAARGAVERTMGAWRTSLEEYMRNNLEGIRAGEFRDRIAGLGNLSENVNRDKNPQDQPLWKDAVKAALTTEQNEVWQKELTARSDYRERATAAMAISELDRRRRLSTEQFNKLEPIITKVVKDYSTDITRYLSNDWQLRSYYLLVPITAIPEAELKAILTPEQAKLVQERDLAQVHSYWDGIKSYHEQRVKEKK